MNKNDIEQILRLQRGAYELLLWIDKRAEQEHGLLSDELLARWDFAESCESWVREMHGMIPQAFRPELDNIPAFERLFSSFFQTSFHLVENAPIWAPGPWGGMMEQPGKRRKLVAGPPAAKKSAKGKAKVGESAHELRLFALEELALEHELFPNRVQLEEVATQPSLQGPLTLWTYFLELNRRATFASQGAAVRALWLSMDKAERIKMKADDVISARSVIVDGLRAVLGDGVAPTGIKIPAG